MHDTTFAAAAQFHGHVCPGLATGFRMTRAALLHLQAGRAEDEHLVAVVENDACGVDAVQFLSGCTFGKGNLIFHDYGKQVYTFYQRASGRAVRVTTVDNPQAPTDRQERVDWLLQAAEDEVVSVEEIRSAPPEYARIRASVTCAFCGERVMETRARLREGQVCCLPCSEDHPETSG